MEKQLVKPVAIVDVDIPFGSMIILLVKLALAAIPAMLIIAVVVFFISVFFGALIAGISTHH